MDYRIIKSPSSGTLEILGRRRTSGKNGQEERFDAVGLIQGKVIDMIYAADIAEKAAGVFAEDIRGLCPQHITPLAVFGDTASVEAALRSVRNHFERDSKEGLPW